MDDHKGSIIIASTVFFMFLSAIILAFTIDGDWGMLKISKYFLGITIIGFLIGLVLEILFGILPEILINSRFHKPYQPITYPLLYEKISPNSVKVIYDDGKKRTETIVRVVTEGTWEEIQ